MLAHRRIPAPTSYQTPESPIQGPPDVAGFGASAGQA